MTPVMLVKWLFIIVVQLVDETPQHNHFQSYQLPTVAAEAFTQACQQRNPFPSDPDGKLCSVFLLVMAGLESRFQLHIIGDGGRAVGPFQEHTGGELRDQSWLSSSLHYLNTVSIAIRECPDQPIARLAGERCGQSVHHARRWAQIIKLVNTTN